MDTPNCETRLDYSEDHVDLQIKRSTRVLEYAQAWNIIKDIFLLEHVNRAFTNFVITIWKKLQISREFSRQPRANIDDAIFDIITEGSPTVPLSKFTKVKNNINV